MGVILDAAMIAANIAAVAATALSTKYKIEEGIGDYGRAIADIDARIGETQAERDRRIEATKAEGVMALKEMGAQAAFEGRMAMTQAEMIYSAEGHRLGISGVRARGSPLMAAQQNVDLAYAAADRTLEKGKTGMAMGGLKLQTAFENIGAQTSMLTSEYQRKHAEASFKQSELIANKSKMVRWAALGGLPGLAGSFYDVGKDYSSFSDWFNQGK
jgi:hypothetical protein